MHALVYIHRYISSFIMVYIHGRLRIRRLRIGAGCVSNTLRKVLARCACAISLALAIAKMSKRRKLQQVEAGGGAENEPSRTTEGEDEGEGEAGEEEEGEEEEEDDERLKEQMKDFFSELDVDFARQKRNLMTEGIRVGSINTHTR